MTPEKQAEFAKCKDDINYFIEKYCNIVLTDEQRAVVDHINSGDDVVLSLNRDSGKTLTNCLCAVWSALFTFKSNIVVVSMHKQTSRHMIQRITTILEQLPLWMNAGLVKNQAYELAFANGSSIRISDLGYMIGLTISLIVADEVPLYHIYELPFNSTRQILFSGSFSPVQMDTFVMDNFTNRRRRFAVVTK